MRKAFKVIDLFAGPGGLAEGFASVQVGDQWPFEIALSVEKEATAHATLQLRSFIRQFGKAVPQAYLDALDGTAAMPDWSKRFPEEWRAATDHVLRLELGTETATETLKPLLAELSKQDTIVVGGPPCQAYSLAGRVKNQGMPGYKASADHRHFLYREYISILKAVRPIAFVMENVKGLLSSKVDGVRILDLVLADLRSAGGDEDSYRLIALTSPTTSERQRGVGEEFLVRAERHGVPQARHRMFIVGIRADHVGGLNRRSILLPERREAPVTVAQALAGLPPLRSGLASDDSFAAWRETMIDQMDAVIAAISTSAITEVKALEPEAKRLRDVFWMRCPVLSRTGVAAVTRTDAPPEALDAWLGGSARGRIANHETRSHMPSDLGRYFFTALFGRFHGWSPKAEMYPEALAPDHRNWGSGNFADRFRVQLDSRPSTTVTSHISKDGHYFIHPDPLQCRALTVREAARLQTFPDDYIFLGNRTAQYVQVGNAVPPFLARQIAQALYHLLAGEEAALDDPDAGSVGGRPLQASASGRS